MDTELTLQTVNAAILRDAAAAALNSNALSEFPLFEVQLLPTGSLFDSVGVVLDLSPAVVPAPVVQSAPASPASSLMTYSSGGVAVPVMASIAGGALSSSGHVLNVAA